MTNPNAQRSSYARPTIGILSSAALLFALQGSVSADQEQTTTTTVVSTPIVYDLPEKSSITESVASPRAASTVGRTAVRSVPDVYCWDGAKEFTVAKAKDQKRKNIGSACLLATKEDWYKHNPENEVKCLVKLWTRESQFDQTAYNKGSGATGIPQALPGSKMASAGKDWRTNPKTQIKWGLGYIDSRYGSPCDAWEHSEQKGWY